MMDTWPLLVLIAQFLNAAVALIDKFLVTSRIGKPVVYAFYVTALSAFVLLLLPFVEVGWPSPRLIGFSILAALFYAGAIIFLYRAFRRAPASEIIPIVGAFTALGTFGFGTLFLKETMPPHFVLGATLLIIGTLLISHFRIRAGTLGHTILAGILFGLSAVAMKATFLEGSFVDGFFWSRIANVCAALVIFLWPGNARVIRSSVETTSLKTKTMILGNKLLAGCAAVLILIAISMAHVSLVNALAGTQFIFLLILAFFFRKKLPEYFLDIRHDREIIHKTGAVIIIAIGMAIIFL